MTNPYESPRGPGTHGRSIALGLIVVLVGIALPVLGLVGSVGGMMLFFDQAADTQNMPPERLAQVVATSLLAELAAVIMGVAMASLGIILIVRARRRTKRE